MRKSRHSPIENLQSSLVKTGHPSAGWFRPLWEASGLGDNLETWTDSGGDFVSCAFIEHGFTVKFSKERAIQAAKEGRLREFLEAEIAIARMK